jgi:AhpD family alkylhydroperoxidase
MSSRLNYPKIAPVPYEAMMGLGSYLEHCGLDSKLMHMVRLRCSQINGCAYCVDMHSRDARLAGEPERRVHSVAVWEESPLFDEKEKAAFAWAESLTHLSETHAPDAVWERVRAHFNEKELADLTWLVASINAWNRLGVGLRSQPPAKWPKLPAE